MNLDKIFASLRHRREGQTLPLLVLMVVVLIVFVGLGIDLGFAYLTRASLSKAVDSACLAGVRSLSLSQASARQIALSTFDLNYEMSGVEGRQVAAPTVNANWTIDANDNLFLDVDSAVRINTFFVRVLPNWKTMQVGSKGQALRPKVVMSLVLDRSGSMNGNGGAAALPPAVSSFIDVFDDVRDRAAMVSFASHSTADDVPMGRPFRAAIKSAANVMPFAGGTGSPLGLTNGFAQVQTVAVGPNEEVVKVCVFFTDGLANIVQETLNCAGNPTQMNFGGYDTGNFVGFFNPANGTQLCTISGGNPPCCPGVSTFRSEIDGTQKTFSRANVTAEAEFRARKIADGMRANGIIVFSIGLGDDTIINKTFLRQVANDPMIVGHIPTGYDGEAVFAPDAGQLKQVFELIASKILLRLTQ